MEPWFSLGKCPEFQLPREGSKVGASNEIREFRDGRGYSARNFIATDARQHNAIASGAYGSGALTFGLVATAVTSGSHLKLIWFDREQPRIFGTEVNVKANASSLFFYLAEIGTLIPVGFRISEVRQGIDSRGFAALLGDDGVCHANDGRGIHSAAELCQDRRIRAQPSAHRFPKHRAKLFFVLRIGRVADSLVRIKIPVFRDRSLSNPQADKTGRRNRLDSDVRRQMSRGEERKPTGNILLVKFDGLSPEQNKRIENAAPGYLFLIQGIVKWTSADGVFSQDQGTVVRIPNG